MNKLISLSIVREVAYAYPAFGGVYPEGLSQREKENYILRLFADRDETKNLISMMREEEKEHASIIRGLITGLYLRSLRKEVEEYLKGTLLKEEDIIKIDNIYDSLGVNPYRGIYRGMKENIFSLPRFAYAVSSLRNYGNTIVSGWVLEELGPGKIQEDMVALGYPDAIVEEESGFEPSTIPLSLFDSIRMKTVDLASAVRPCGILFVKKMGRKEAK